MIYLDLLEIAKKELKRYPSIITDLSPKKKREIMGQLRKDYNTLREICKTNKRWKKVPFSLKP
jgi:hypothetical protein